MYVCIQYNIYIYICVQYNTIYMYICVCTIQYNLYSWNILLCHTAHVVHRKVPHGANIHQETKSVILRRFDSSYHVFIIFSHVVYKKRLDIVTGTRIKPWRMYCWDCLVNCAKHGRSCSNGVPDLDTFYDICSLRFHFFCSFFWLVIYWLGRWSHHLVASI